MHVMLCPISSHGIFGTGGGDLLGKTGHSESPVGFVVYFFISCYDATCSRFYVAPDCSALFIGTNGTPTLSGHPH